MQKRFLNFQENIVNGLIIGIKKLNLMKQHFIIKSISDVITNSSSEVFVLNKEDAKYFAIRSFDEDTADCITLIKMNWEYIFEQGRFETEIFQELLNVNDEILTNNCTPSEDEWSDFVNKHLDDIEEKIFGKYIVEIEDHFYNSNIEIDKARDKCLYYENLH